MRDAPYDMFVPRFSNTPIAQRSALALNGHSRIASSLACRWILSLAGAAMFAAPAATAHGSEFFATQVIATSPGSFQDPAFSDPTLALGGPRGGGTSQGSLDVYNLGVGGSITLGFDDGAQQHGIFDGPGPDFTVFENPFYAGGNTHASFAELMFVSVSTNGVDFARFPVVSNTPAPVSAFGTIDPANVSGFAGVTPVLANVDTNTVDPFDASVSGGDSFDLSALSSDPLVTSGKVNLSAIRYVRLDDVVGDGSLTDENGHPIYDPTGPGTNGADLDAIAVINGGIAIAPEPSGTWIVGGAAAAVLLLRRRSRAWSLE